MTDDPKVVTLQTGYVPEDAPPDATDIQQLRWDITAVQGSVFPGDFRDTWKQMAGTI